MTRQEAEDLINHYQVEVSKFQAEDHKERARESKLRADLVQRQLEVYDETLRRLKEQEGALAAVPSTKNWPFSS